jgi:predicted negative regulator of RcsB-dependent stress response
VADHLTEEEQIEAIKKWWQDNWLSIVLPIVVAMLAYTGWNYWSDFKQKQSEEASDKYQLLLEDLRSGAALSTDQKANAIAKATDLLAHYGGTFYADASAFTLAKFAVEDGDLDKAESILRELVEGASNESVSVVAKARLARVLLSNEKSDEALQLVSGEVPEGARALYSEIRGDVYLAKNQPDAANTAYQEALESLEQSQLNRFGILQLKVNSTKSAVTSTPDTPQGDNNAEAKG